jgi:hypothetical protein
MDFWQRMKSTLDEGVSRSKDLLSRAKERAKEVGERGVLTYEINQLEKQAKEIAGKLGTVVYDLFTDREFDLITADNVDVKPLIDEIHRIRESVEEKEAALRELGGDDPPE